jgi:hypothetical protein
MEGTDRRAGRFASGAAIAVDATGTTRLNLTRAAADVSLMAQIGASITSTLGSPIGI